MNTEKGYENTGWFIHRLFIYFNKHKQKSVVKLKNGTILPSDKLPD